MVINEQTQGLGARGRLKNDRKQNNKQVGGGGNPVNSEIRRKGEVGITRYCKGQWPLNKRET